MKVTCAVCGKDFPIVDVTPVRFVRPSVASLIRAASPSWTTEGYICHDDLNEFRGQFVQHVPMEQKGELTALGQEVIDSLRQHDILKQHMGAATDDTASLGMSQNRQEAKDRSRAENEKPPHIPALFSPKREEGPRVICLVHGQSETRPSMLE